MAEETITIYRVDTGEAVKSIADLRNNIKAYKEALEDLEVGSKEYADTLTALQVNQAALKNAMHATTEAGEDQGDGFAQVAKEALGLGTSYNALVRQMAILDQQFRSTEDAAKRAQLGDQIKAINDQLKEMDAARGKFGRNVGDYFNQMSGALKDVVKDLPSGLGTIKKGLDDTTKSLALMGKQPILGIVALLAPVINSIAAGLKENQTALDAIHKLGKALEPVLQFAQGVLEKIAGWISKAVDYVLELGEQSGINFTKIVSGAVGVGNALLQFLLTPIRNVIDGARAMGQVFQNVFKGNFRQAAQDAKQAVKEIGDNFRRGFDFKGNFEAGKKVGEEFAAGLSSTKRTAAEAGKAIKEEVLAAMVPTADEIAKALEKVDTEADRRRKEREAQEREAVALAEQMGAEITAAVQEQLDAQLEAEWNALQEERRIKEQRLATFMAYASALGNLAGSLADIYEADAEADEKAARKAKALRTAGAIISTISGAVSAFTSTWSAAELPLSVKAVLAPVNAASVLAAGYAQVRQINAVKVGNAGGGGAVMPAPAFTASVPQVRNVTGASEEERLNRMAGPQRVYILASDLQAERDSSRVRIQETSF